jgi:hypothetical protein
MLVVVDDTSVHATVARVLARRRAEKRPPGAPHLPGRAALI